MGAPIGPFVAAFTAILAGSAGNTWAGEQRFLNVFGASLVENMATSDQQTAEVMGAALTAMGIVVSRSAHAAWALAANTNVLDVAVQLARGMAHERSERRRRPPCGSGLVKEAVDGARSILYCCETAIALRVPSVAMQLQVEPIMAVCEVLLHLIKGGMTYSELNESDSSPTAEVESAITWSTPQAGGAGAAGLDFQEQLLSRKKLNILTFTLTLLQCGATLCLGNNAAQLEAFDFVFTMDIISSLDSFRWRCLSELGLHEGVHEGMTLKAVCLQRLFGLELGKATLLWSSLGSEDRPITLIALGEDHRTGSPSVTFRWKDIPPERPCDESLQPMEGCFLSVKLCVVIEAFQRLVDMVTTVVMPFVELLEPPPFAVGWCRIRMHDLTIEIPEVPLAKALPMTFSIPSLLLSSLEGLGHLFTCLDTLPSRHGNSQLSTAHLQGEEVAETARRRRLCACGRQLGCFLRLGNGFTPLRGAVNWTTAWQIRQTKSGYHVLVGYDEFLDLVKHQVTSRALDSLLLSFETKLGKDAMPKSGDDVPQLEISASSRRSRSSRSWLSGFKRSEKSGKSGSVARKATDVAKEWATLQEAVLRLQRQREELKLKKDALRQAADEAKQESKHQATQVEDDLALQIAVQRGKQAELSAQAEEQKQLIAQLLQRRQQNALRF
eukprot:symbB.v1.2.003439.t1/scaffold195.1/size274553/10